MSKLFIFLVMFVALLVVAGAVILLDTLSLNIESDSTKHKLTIGRADIFVDIARTPAERTQGLSGRETLAPSDGLLFIFEKNDTHAIWMKDMKFPIDIIWIDEHFVITDIVENVSPSSFPEIFEPKNVARYVLEVNAGWAAQNSIQRGAVVEGLREIR